MFSCPICLGLVYKPKTCATCDNDLYCSPCVDELLNKKCPICSQGDFKELHKMFKTILGKTEIACSKGSSDCTSNFGTVKYEDLEKHFKDCVKQVPCPYGCGTFFKTTQNMEDVHSHYHDCPMICRECDLCGQEHNFSGEETNPRDCIQVLKALVEDKEKTIEKQTELIEQLDYEFESKLGEIRVLAKNSNLEGIKQLLN